MNKHWRITAVVIAISALLAAWSASAQLRADDIGGLEAIALALMVMGMLFEDKDPRRA
jgi:hypothetical protein